MLSRLSQRKTKLYPLRKILLQIKKTIIFSFYYFFLFLLLYFLPGFQQCPTRFLVKVSPRNIQPFVFLGMVSNQEENTNTSLCFEPHLPFIFYLGYSSLNRDSCLRTRAAYSSSTSKEPYISQGEVYVLTV